MAGSSGTIQGQQRWRSAFVDYSAADKVIELREARGLSQEGLATAIKRYAQAEGWFKVHGAVDPFTIRQIEDDGALPSERVRLVVALFFGLAPSEIWKRSNRRPREKASA